MNPTGHLIRKDWHRARPALLGWYALVALKAWGVWLLSRSDSATADLAALGTFFNLLNGLEAVIGALLAAWLVREDPADGANSFWPTRPISRGLLLRAKILGAFLFFLAAPLLLLAPVWLVAGFSAPDFLAAVADWTLLQSLFVAVGLLVGALTRDLGQALLGAPLLGLALLGVATWLRRDPGPPAWWSAVLTLLVALAGIVLAYGLRRRGPALGLISAGFCLIAGFGLPALPPIEYLAAWPDPTRPLQIGETRGTAPSTWRLVALDETGGASPALLMQSTRPWIGLRPDSQFREAAPRFTVLDPVTSQPIALIPSRLGTVQAASLRISRWHLALPADFKTPANGVRLFASPPAQSPPQP